MYKLQTISLLCHMRHTISDIEWEDAFRENLHKDMFFVLL